MDAMNEHLRYTAGHIEMWEQIIKDVKDDKSNPLDIDHLKDIIDKLPSREREVEKYNGKKIGTMRVKSCIFCNPATEFGDVSERWIKLKKYNYKTKEYENESSFISGSLLIENCDRFIQYVKHHRTNQQDYDPDNYFPYHNNGICWPLCTILEKKVNEKIQQTSRTQSL